MISIITPVYNGEDFIEFCIKNVIEQACLNIEHIIVDGGSTDKTVEIIKRYADQFPHIRWISEKDRGQSDAMNKGISMAKGEILGFLNDDDFYEPNVLNSVSAIFQGLPEPSFVVGNCNIWGNEGELISKNRPKYLSLIGLLSGVFHFPCNPSAYFYHRSLHEKVGLYEVENYYSMDLDFILRAIPEVKVKYINKTWGNYRSIKGTKSNEDKEKNFHRNNRETLKQKYIKKIPIYLRFLLFFSNFILARMVYFLEKPQEIFPVIKRKL